MRKLFAWTEEYTSNESTSICKELALHHALLGGPEGTRIADSINSDNYRLLCDWVLPYSDTASPAELYHCRQALAFFGKSEYLDLGIDRNAVAFRKFLEAETLCRETNAIFSKWSRGEFYFPRDVESVFFRAQRKIATILGNVPKLSELKFRFGPGATTRTKKHNASVREKLQAGVSCSEELFPYAQAVLAELPHLSGLLDSRLGVGDPDTALVPVEVTPGLLSFVPKNAKTFRAIVTEPVLNGVVQLGINGYLTDRLLAFGVDLKDQSVNQRLAREGSLTGALATLDLSSASDTISRELVYNLLPLDWACFLNAFRTRKVVHKGKVINQEKFSSMGNGFTFPLESLIFYALTAACCESDETVSVYGDDIICPTQRVPLVTKVLVAAGFVVNTDKSYWSGSFRESCGADFFRGFDIRPYYQRKLVSPASLFVLHNYYVRSKQIEEAELVRSFLHREHLLFGPDGYGDGHLLGDWTPRPHKRELGYCGSLFDTFTLKNRRDVRPNQPGDGILPHYQIYMRSSQTFLKHLGVEHPAYWKFDLEEAPSPLPFDKAGIPGVTYPGSSGYKRISIYTLTTN